MKRVLRAALALGLLISLLAGCACPALAEDAAEPSAEPSAEPINTPTAEPSDDSELSGEPDLSDEPSADASAPAEDASAPDEGEAAAAFEPYVIAPQDGKVHYVAVTTVALRIRVEPSDQSNYVGSYRKGEAVDILILDAQWCKVRKDDVIGYAMTMYLDDIRAFDPDTGAVGEPVEPPAAPTGALYEATDDFTPNFVGYTLKSTYLLETPDESGLRLVNLKIYEKVVCESFGEDGWARCRYAGKIGYIPTDALFKFDRINPYAGDIPGVTVFPLMLVTKHATNIYEVGGDEKKPLKTVNAGAVISACEPDAEGRYVFDYWRTKAYIKAEDVSETFPVVRYDQAQPGDLIGVMSTFYAVGVSTLNYQGRNWNIYLGGTLSSNRVLQPGEVWNQYSVMGPYRKSTGYHSAPIASPTKLTGYGGGTCQVNTTMYNLLIQLPILVNHRVVHANSGTYYVRKGFDAAVGGGSINMIFTNTLPYPIRFQFMISDGVLTVCVFRDQE